MTKCVLLRCDGTRAVVDWAHGEVAARLGGAVSFVGAVDDDVVVVGRADAAALPVNAHVPAALVFAPPVRGDVVLAAVGEEEADVDTDGLLRLLETL